MTTLKTKAYTERSTTYRLTVVGGLHYMRGNRAPYFSLTAIQDRKERGRWQDDMGGCCHDLILKHYPELADLAALHLSDMDGAPMHAVENGWYWLAGAMPEGVAQYHGGNGTPAKSADECLQVFADHCRIGIGEARGILAQVVAELGLPQESQSVRPYSSGDVARAKSRLAELMDGMRPRWKREAIECIKAHGLQIYGDHYAPTADLSDR